MSDLGMERDAITYSALISALSKGRQWGLAIDVFNHMVAEGVECDAVTCCSLITALDKGGQWQLAEQVGFCVVLSSHHQFRPAWPSVGQLAAKQQVRVVVVFKTKQC